MQARIENDIVAVPESFQIEKTTYSPTEGSVTVIEWFKYPNFSEKKRYTYRFSSVKESGRFMITQL